MLTSTLDIRHEMDGKMKGGWDEAGGALQLFGGGRGSMVQEAGFEGKEGRRGSPAEGLPKNRKESPLRVSYHSSGGIFSWAGRV